jgi:hypothetical protein
MKWLKKLNNCFHGKGHEPYKTPEAKLTFADSLLKIADKLFFAPFIPFVTISFYEQSPAQFWLQLVLSVLFFIMATCLRHEALLIIDEAHQQD